MMYLAVAINDRDHNLLPGLISLFTFSKAYHCELRFSDGMAISSTYAKNVHMKKSTYNHWNWVCVPLPWIDEDSEKCIRAKAEAFVRAELKYDLIGAILGKWSRHFFLNDARYFCSELCVVLLYEYIPYLRSDRWYSPGDLWKTVADNLDEEFPEYLDPSYSLHPNEQDAARRYVTQGRGSYDPLLIFEDRDE